MMAILMSPVMWFFAFAIVVWGGAIYFWRGAIKELSIEAGAHAKLYAAAYARGAALVSISALQSFIEVFERLSPDVANVLNWYGWLVLFSKPVLAALITFGAFMDTSVQRARDRSNLTTLP